MLDPSPLFKTYAAFRARELSEQRSECEGRYRQEGGPSEHAAELASEIRVSHVLGGDRIHRTGDGGVEGEEDHADQVVEMDPGKGLTPAPESTSDAEREGNPHQCRSFGNG